MADGISLKAASHKAASGRLVLQTRALHGELPDGLPVGKADNQILGIVMALQADQPERQVILVSKDINMRIKAAALGLAAEDYFNDKVLEDTDLLYAGTREIDQAFWEKTRQKPEKPGRKAGKSYYRMSGNGCAGLLLNEILWQDSEPPFAARVIAPRRQNRHPGNPGRLQPQQTHGLGHYCAQP